MCMSRGHDSIRGTCFSPEVGGDWGWARFSRWLRIFHRLIPPRHPRNCYCYLQPFFPKKGINSYSRERRPGSKCRERMNSILESNKKKDAKREEKDRIKNEVCSKRRNVVVNGSIFRTIRVERRWAKISNKDKTREWRVKSQEHERKKTLKLGSQDSRLTWCHVYKTSCDFLFFRWNSSPRIGSCKVVFHRKCRMSQEDNNRVAVFLIQVNE